MVLTVFSRQHVAYTTRMSACLIAVLAPTVQSNSWWLSFVGRLLGHVNVAVNVFRGIHCSVVTVRVITRTLSVCYITVPLPAMTVFRNPQTIPRERYKRATLCSTIKLWCLLCDLYAFCTAVNTTEYSTVYFLNGLMTS